MVADLCGDFRDEIVLIGSSPEGHFSMSIHTPTAVIRQRQITRTADHGYQMWLAHHLTRGGTDPMMNPQQSLDRLPVLT